MAEIPLQRRLIEGQLEDSEIDALAVVALAGASVEAMQYEEVCSRRTCAQATDMSGQEHDDVRWG